MEILLTDSECKTLHRFFASCRKEIEEITEQIKHTTTHDSLLVLERLKSMYEGRVDGVMKVLDVLNINIYAKHAKQSTTK